MEQYIPKSAVVAEIEKLRKIQPADEFQPKEQNKIDWLAGKEFAIVILQLFLDTLEVKEVDLEKETKKWWKERLHLNPESQLWMDAHQSIVFAKHFFELGLSVSNKAQKGERV